MYFVRYLKLKFKVQWDSKDHSSGNDEYLTYIFDNLGMAIKVKNNMIQHVTKKTRVKKEKC